METKMITIPFDLERAKRIQADEEPGKIVTKQGNDVRVVCWDMILNNPILALIKSTCFDFSGNPFIEEVSFNYTHSGKIDDGRISTHDLMLQVPEYTHFKDGDVLSNIDGDFVFILNGNERCKTSLYVCWYSDNKISFGGAASGDNIEKYRYATKKEKQQLINALKKSTDPRAKQYLKRFFGIEEASECKFKPFQKVLVSNDVGSTWIAGFFSHYAENIFERRYGTVGGHFWKHCIPYNDQTKHLLGTTDNWEG